MNTLLYNKKKSKVNCFSFVVTISLEVACYIEEVIYFEVK
ncbi:hypothetical protein bthur0011_46510 [Bacillus thuringiensis serovar huazhongensis BGSC 4BD1]|nr:hypothetical protein bthur0011_46510 [Bacillus thuringiensis serovar huazhongensis BGSC 4BD1]KLA34057.1 hypothetical protein B4080_5272 [Bacillus cereus]